MNKVLNYISAKGTGKISASNKILEKIAHYPNNPQTEKATKLPSKSPGKQLESHFTLLIEKVGKLYLAGTSPAGENAYFLKIK